MREGGRGVGRRGREGRRGGKEYTDMVRARESVLTREWGVL
jgi:hypothetical protein